MLVSVLSVAVLITTGTKVKFHVLLCTRKCALSYAFPYRTEHIYLDFWPSVPCSCVQKLSSILVISSLACVSHTEL